MDERSLIAGIRQGDVDAFESVFRFYHPRLCGFAFRYLNNAAAAEDLVQDLFTNLWQKRGRLEIRTSLRAYLFAALRNRLLNKSASMKVEQKWFGQADAHESDVADATPLSDAVLASRDTASIVRAAVDSLPPGCRSIVLLRFEQELSVTEIAEALGLAPKTVENQLARGRKLLRERLPQLID
jgi:RNA polymerase sigma-70 factor, ECF subfamily